MADPPPPSPAFLIMALGRSVRDAVERDLTVHGLSLRHVSALGHLAREPGVTAQSMQATLRRLEEDGAVERRTDAGRGRTAQLHVTEAGATLVARGRAVLAVADRRLLASIPADRHGALVEDLFAAFVAGRDGPGP